MFFGGWGGGGDYFSLVVFLLFFLIQYVNVTFVFLQLSSKSLPEHNRSGSITETTSFPDQTSVTDSSSSSSPIIESPSGSRTRRVESVTNLITETSSTDIQSYAELVLYLNGSNKEYTTVRHPPPLRHTQSFNKHTYSNSRHNRVQRTHSDRIPFASRNLIRKGVYNNSCVSNLQGNFGSSFFREESRSLEDLQDSQEYSPNTTPPGQSTLVYREGSSPHHSNNPASVNGVNHISNHIEAERSTNVEFSTENHSQPYQDILHSTEHSADFSGLAQEGEILQNSTSISPDSFESSTTLEHKVASILCLDINKSEGKVECEQGNSESRSEVNISDTEVEKIPLVKTPVRAGFEAVETSSIIISSPVVTTIAAGPLSEDSVDSEEDLAVKQKIHQHISPLIRERSQVFCCNTEQVTGIHNQRGKKTECCTGDSFKPPSTAITAVAEGGDRVMDTCMHTQHRGNHVSDSEPVSLNSIKTCGYPSNCRSKEREQISVSAVPHHSLSLAISDPESPMKSSCKVSVNY